MREEESIQRQGEEEDQVRDNIYDENCSSIFAPFVIQQAGHHWMSQQVCMRVQYLGQHNRKEDINVISEYPLAHTNLPIPIGICRP